MIKRFRVTVEGKDYEVAVEMLADGEGAPATVPPAPRAQPTPTSIEHVSTAPLGAGAEIVRSPLAGVVSKIHVQAGQAVKEGEHVLTLEAMKVYNHVFATRAGHVKEIHAAEGGAVREAAPLLTLE